MQKEEWYQTWFDTDYYHLLYRHRDITEAENNINALINFLQLPKSAKILDLACGTGRHAKHIASHGYAVTGYDLSPNNIDKAKKFENSLLHFEIKDMLQPFGNKKFDAVFNLFTSFGYFPSKQNHQTALQHVYDSLNTGGTFVIDFLNSTKIKQQLVPQESKEIDGVQFFIKRFWDAGFIVKQIIVKDKTDVYFFEEKVMGLTLADFTAFFNTIDFQIENVFGNFSLHPFDEKTSERLILVVKK
ncbi:MAG: methyltransferase domain-containing protein [Schleiferiaceae bacterium]|nr:methyltransferase domain-containing protein [Schleiferiaceae bacterium]